MKGAATAPPVGYQKRFNRRPVLAEKSGKIPIMADSVLRVFMHVLANLRGKSSIPLRPRNGFKPEKDAACCRSDTV